MARPTMTLDQQRQAILRKISHTDTCWLWTGQSRVATSSAGVINRRPVYRRRYAYRLVWEIEYGPCPKNLEPDHLCRNTMCVNPAHIEWVTHAVNLQRIPRSPLCPQGHHYTEETRIVRRGKRECRLCVRARNNRNYWRRKQRRVMSHDSSQLAS